MSQSGCGKVTASSFTHVGGTFTVCWPAIHLATPRAMPSVPSVAMNGMTLSRVMNRPLMTPASPPARTPSSTRDDRARAVAQRNGGHDARQRDHRSHRQVDPAAHHDHRHADRAERDNNRLRDDDPKLRTERYSFRRVGHHREDRDDGEQAEKRHPAARSDCVWRTGDRSVSCGASIQRHPPMAASVAACRRSGVHSLIGRTGGRAVRGS